MFNRVIQKFRLFRREQLWYRGVVDKDALVLDVGSGLNPCIRANVLCEKFAMDDTERSGTLIADRPLVLGDAEYLPFRDRCFDYVICSQVFEHLADPELAAAELQRVAAKGRIDTPGYFSEMIAGHPFHLWYTYMENGILHLREKRRAIHDPDITEIINKLKREDDPAFAEFVFRHYDLFVTVYYWEDTVRIKTERIADGVLSSQSPVKAATSRDDVKKLFSIIGKQGWNTKRPWEWRRARDAKFWLKSLLRHRYRRHVNLWDIIACPSCHGLLEERTDRSIRCERCGLIYPLFGSIPGLLKEYSQRALF